MASSDLVIEIISATGVPKSDVAGHSDPFLKVWVEIGGHKGDARKTSFRRDTGSPVWLVPVSLGALSPAQRDAVVHFEMWDFDRGSMNDLLARASVAVSELALEQERELDMTPVSAFKHATILLRVRRLSGVYAPRKKVFLIRHGESRWNKAQSEHDVKGMLHFDHALNEDGVEGARSFNRAWKEAAAAASLWSHSTQVAHHHHHQHQHEGKDERASKSEPRPSTSSVSSDATVPAASGTPTGSPSHASKSKASPTTSSSSVKSTDASEHRHGPLHRASLNSLLHRFTPQRHHATEAQSDPKLNTPPPSSAASSAAAASPSPSAAYELPPFSANLEQFLAAERVFVSPLSRAVSTALLTLQDHPELLNGIRLLSALREIKNAAGLDTVGSAAGIEIRPTVINKLRESTILTEQEIAEIVRPELDIGDAVGNWWTSASEMDHTKQLKRRMGEVLNILKYDSANTIICVGHSLFFKLLLGECQAGGVLARSKPELAAQLANEKLPNVAMVCIDLDFTANTKGLPEIVDAEMVFDGHRLVPSPAMAYIPQLLAGAPSIEAAIENTTTALHVLSGSAVRTFERQSNSTQWSERSSVPIASSLSALPDGHSIVSPAPNCVAFCTKHGVIHVATAAAIKSVNGAPLGTTTAATPAGGWSNINLSTVLSLPLCHRNQLVIDENVHDASQPFSILFSSIDGRLFEIECSHRSDGSFDCVAVDLSARFSLPVCSAVLQLCNDPDGNRIVTFRTPTQDVLFLAQGAGAGVVYNASRLAGLPFNTDPFLGSHVTATGVRVIFGRTTNDHMFVGVGSNDQWQAIDLTRRLKAPKISPQGNVCHVEAPNGVLYLVYRAADGVLQALVGQPRSASRPALASGVSSIGYEWTHSKAPQVSACSLLGSIGHRLFFVSNSRVITEAVVNAAGQWSFNSVATLV